MKYKKGDIIYVCGVISPDKRYYGVVASVDLVIVSVFWFSKRSIESYAIDSLSWLGFSVIE
jgi:hypothetical protein